MKMKTNRNVAKNSQGEPVAADLKGSNLAFICQICGHPVLAQTAKNARGHWLKHPEEQVNCSDCNASYSVKEKDGIFVIAYKDRA